MIVEVWASRKPQLTPGLYKQPADWEDVVYQATALVTNTTVDISPEIILKMFFDRVKKNVNSMEVGSFLCWRFEHHKSCVTKLIPAWL